MNVGCFADENAPTVSSSSIPAGPIPDIHLKCEEYALENKYPLINYQNNKCDFSQSRSTLTSESVGCLTTTSAIRTVFAYSSLGYVSVGCFDFSVSLQSIRQESSSNTAVKTIIDNCAIAASEIRSSVFAISGSGTCYGGVDISTLTKHTNGCGMVGDASSKGYQVYVNPTLAYTTLGCLNGFDLTTIRSSFVFSEGTASYDVNSCGAMAVVQSNFLFAFSNSGSVCFVGNETAQVANSAYSQNCGSPGSVTVNVLTVSLFPQYQSLPYISQHSLYQSIGCYRDNVARVIPILQSSNSNPVECALKAEYDYTQAIVFGLQAGGECRTGDSVSSAVSLSLVSNCPLLGSASANQVFVRKYCFPVWTTVSTYNGNVMTYACRKCLKGYYCPGDNTEIPCAMDHSTIGREGSSECT